MYKIYNEDCIEGMKRLDNQSVDLILTDLPYGIMSYKQDKKIKTAEMWQEFRRILKPRCVVALFASSRFTIELAASNLEWYKYKFVWIKNRATNFINAKNRPLSKYEEILIFSNGLCIHANQTDNRMKYYPQGLKLCKRVSNGCRKFGGTYHQSPSNRKIESNFSNYPVDVLYFDAPHNVKRNHPNEKPTPLLEYLIKTYSNEGETVLDATMGSGSTGVACVNTNRDFIGYEIDASYYEAAKKRIVKAMEDKEQSFWSGYDAEKIETSVQI